MHDMKAINRERYGARMARLKANGEYEPFKKHKAVEGLKRYRNMSEEQRAEVK